MKLLQLFRDGSEIMASDGILPVDGRFNTGNIKRMVEARNKRVEKNFPHKIADAYAIYKGGRIANGYGSIVKLN